MELEIETETDSPKNRMIEARLRGGSYVYLCSDQISLQIVRYLMPQTQIHWLGRGFDCPRTISDHKMSTAAVGRGGTDSGIQELNVLWPDGHPSISRDNCAVSDAANSDSLVGSRF
jgi:hypothetical protein